MNIQRNILLKLSITLLLFFIFTENKALAFDKIIFGCATKDLADFESFVIQAKKAGATHINLSNEDLPWSYWQYDDPLDPYPSWVISNVGLMKISTPDALKSFIPQDYAETVMQILEARCKILRKHGLKASFKTFEPQMLPEKVFELHPMWRGARVDHPLRSKNPRWAPSIDHPEVLKLYEESVAKLIKRCPEIDILTLTTNDSGTGLDWSGGLYTGKIGNTAYEGRPMEERLSGFFSTLQKGAELAGGSMEIDIQWTREPDPRRIAEKLTQGMAIENLEGPDATPYKAQVGFLLDYFNFYYPVTGIPHVLDFLGDLRKASESTAPRLFVFIGDSKNRDLYFSIYNAYRNDPFKDNTGKANFIEKLALAEVGEKNAEHLVNVWNSLQSILDFAPVLETGGYIYYLGSVQQRWLTRPFVPFPEELKPEEKDYFRTFQFQGRTESHACDMADLQGFRLYSGESGSFLVERISSQISSHIKSARKSLQQIIADPGNKNPHYYKLLDMRLAAFACLVENAVNALNFQAQLDRVKNLNLPPEFNPPANAKAPWDRQLLTYTAKKEMDNIALLIELLESSAEPLLDISGGNRKADIRLLEQELIQNLKKKLQIMNRHWMDYNRLFTTVKG